MFGVLFFAIFSAGWPSRCLRFPFTPPQPSAPTQRPSNAAPPRRAALGAPAQGPPPQCAAPRHAALATPPRCDARPLGRRSGTRRSSPTPPPRFTSELITASARRKLSSSRGRSSVGRRGEVEFGLGPADVARVIVVGDRPPRSRRCADSGRPSPSRAAPSTPQPSTPSRRPQLNSWYVIF